jgi:hypothetical protein
MKKLVVQQFEVLTESHAFPGWIARLYRNYSDLCVVIQMRSVVPFRSGFDALRHEQFASLK